MAHGDRGTGTMPNHDRITNSSESLPLKVKQESDASSYPDSEQQSVDINNAAVQHPQPPSVYDAPGSTDSAETRPQPFERSNFGARKRRPQDKISDGWRSTKLSLDTQAYLPKLPDPSGSKSVEQSRKHIAVVWKPMAFLILSIAVGLPFTGFLLISCSPILITAAAVISIASILAVGPVLVFAGLFVLLTYTRKQVQGFAGSKAVVGLIDVWLIFLTPFYTLFILGVMGWFSFTWSLAMGFCFWAYPKLSLHRVWDLLWHGRSHDTLNRGVLNRNHNGQNQNGPPVRRWNRVVDMCSPVARVVFDYFPLTVHLDEPAGALLKTMSFKTSESAEVFPKQQTNNLDIDLDIEDCDMKLVPKRRRRLYCYHPHGIYGFGLLSLVFGSVSGFVELVPNTKPIVVGVASSLLSIPGFGMLCKWFGFVPASRTILSQVCRQSTKEGNDYDVALIPGGIAEMLEFENRKSPNLKQWIHSNWPRVAQVLKISTPVHSPVADLAAACRKVEIVYLKNREGFIRLALEHNMECRPVYGFGENETFKRYSFLKTLRSSLSRSYGVVIQLFRGRFMTLIPFQVPLNIVVGHPVKFQPLRSDVPTQDEVKAACVAYREALADLFERNKTKFPGYQDAVLKIV